MKVATITENETIMSVLVLLLKSNDYKSTYKSLVINVLSNYEL